MYICIYVYIYNRTYVYMYICIYVYMYIDCGQHMLTSDVTLKNEICIYLYIHIYIYTFAHITVGSGELIVGNTRRRVMAHI